MTVGIYYATTTGKTEDVADRLHNFISSAEAPKDVSDVDDLSEFEGHDQKQEPEPTAEEPPHDTIEPAPQPQEPAGTKLLEHSWLRVQLQPETKSRTDSMEPMGLIERIKGVFVRSTGR